MSLIDKNSTFVEEYPTIPYIIGDGIGRDITPVMIKVVNSAIQKSYGDKKRINWLRVYAGEDAVSISEVGNNSIKNLSVDQIQKIMLPKETINAFKIHKIGIKGPLSTPISEGYRSLNVALRQQLDLYACIRPNRWYKGVPSPIKNPENVNITIFRENTEDVYCAIEWEYNSNEANYIRTVLKKIGVTLPNDSGIGIKQVTESASKRLVRAAIKYAIRHGNKRITLVHKGNIMKFTEGAFMVWGYEVAKNEFRDKIVTELEYNVLSIKRNNPGISVKEIMNKLGYLGINANEDTISEVLNQLTETNFDKMIIINDRVADQMFQQILLRPSEYEIIATLNLNGDYLSDAIAAEVGGLGISPGVNINYETGEAIFEATHGTSPKYAGLDKANPCSIILSAVMMLRHLNWNEAADQIEQAVSKTIESKKVTFDLHRQIEDAELLSCSGFGDEIIRIMNYN
ncbi:NADP-dependent isocitrate dehydrogenase [Candidatus Bathyarchaeota archaeon]|nr:NADP-dependent isocitrate dehydrogenase [Candidatus Bathyarchaeota archaeon]